MIRPLATFACLLVVACGSGNDVNPGSGGGPGSTTSLSVVLNATTEAYPHQDSLASQTARDVSAGVRFLELIDTQGGRWQLFQIGSAPAKVVSYNNGSTTALATLKPEDVRPGHYIKGQMVQDWSRFKLDAVLHNNQGPQKGTLDALRVTSDQVLLDGKQYKIGAFDNVFVGQGINKTDSGVLPMPKKSTTAEAEGTVVNGQWVVSFPVDLKVEAGATGTLTVTVNMHEAFRWSDINTGNNQAGTYDIAPPFYEPVKQFGGNRFDVELQP